MLKILKKSTTELNVQNVYPYRYDYGKGKQVLRIEILDTDHKFDEIKTILENCTDTLSYYEGDTKENLSLKNEYDCYSLDFNCQYTNGIYSVEITKLSEQEQDIKSLSSAVADLALMLGGQQ